MTANRVHHVGLAVADLDASIAFYAELGLVGDAPFEVSGSDAATGNGLARACMQVTFLARDDGQVVELIHHRGHASGRARPAGQLGHARWRLALDGPPLVDPDGLPIDPRAADGPDLEIALVSADPAQTGALLELLGFTAAGEPGQWALGGARCVIEARTGGPDAPPSPDEPGRAHLCVEVDDLPATRDRLVAAGQRLVSEPIRHRDELLWAFAVDPGGSGNVELLQVL